MDRRIFFSNMQEEKGLFKSPTTTSNFITPWYILGKDWIRKSVKLIPWLNLFSRSQNLSQPSTAIIDALTCESLYIPLT